jgi:serine/threonine-protein kinase PRP4
LFPGKDNNEMLRMHQEFKGCFSKRMLKKATFRDKHFDENYVFESRQIDRVTREPIKRMINFTAAGGPGTTVCKHVVSMPDAMQLPLIALFSHFLRLLQIVTGA